MRYVWGFFAAALLAAATLAPAAAQQDEPRVISGTITAVNGHLVTIQRAHGTIVVNDQPALDNQMTGNVAVGRQVLARGHWQDGVFYATSFADANVYGDEGAAQGNAAASDNDGDDAGAGAALAGAATGLRGAVRGTITAVNGHLVTIRNADQSIVVNDQPALNRKLTGSVTVGRDVVAIGYWSAGTFYASTVTDAKAAPESDGAISDFGAFRRIPDSLSGTITGVSGSTVTLQQSTRSVQINDQPALNQHNTGPVAVGRTVVADGYWLHGQFYATAFTDATP